MKFFFLVTTVSLLFSLTEAACSLKLEGSGPYPCPDVVKNTIYGKLSQQVESTAEYKGYVPQGSMYYKDHDRRQLRGIGEGGREMSCASCIPQAGYQACVIMGQCRRRELTVPSTERMVQSTCCHDLIASARDKLEDLTDDLKQSNTPNGQACGLLFSNITITCFA
jgi:hypothetical protein